MHLWDPKVWVWGLKINSAVRRGSLVTHVEMIVLMDILLKWLCCLTSAVQHTCTLAHWWHHLPHVATKQFSNLVATLLFMNKYGRSLSLLICNALAVSAYQRNTNMTQALLEISRSHTLSTSVCSRILGVITFQMAQIWAQLMYLLPIAPPWGYSDLCWWDVHSSDTKSWNRSWELISEDVVRIRSKTSTVE